MKISRAINISVPADEAWQILGPGYGVVDQWASNVFLSTPKANAAEDGRPSGRTCETSLGAFDETVTHYDPKELALSYSASGAKMPGFVRSLVASWEIVPKGAQSCEAQMQMNADLAFPFNVLMGWMMRMNFTKAIRESQEEFKYYAETGKQHPRKVKSLQSPKARQFLKASA